MTVFLHYQWSWAFALNLEAAVTKLTDPGGKGKPLSCECPLWICTSGTISGRHWYTWATSTQDATWLLRATSTRLRSQRPLISHYPGLSESKPSFQPESGENEDSTLSVSRNLDCVSQRWETGEKNCWQVTRSEQIQTLTNLPNKYECPWARHYLWGLRENERTPGLLPWAHTVDYSLNFN